MICVYVYRYMFYIRDGTDDTAGPSPLRDYRLVWILGLEPKFYVKRWFTLGPRNVLASQDPDPVPFMLYSDLVHERVSYYSCTVFLCFVTNLLKGVDMSQVEQ